MWQKFKTIWNQSSPDQKIGIALVCVLSFAVILIVISQLFKKSSKAFVSIANIESEYAEHQTLSKSLRSRLESYYKNEIKMKEGRIKTIEDDVSALKEKLSNIQ